MKKIVCLIACFMLVGVCSFAVVNTFSPNGMVVEMLENIDTSSNLSDNVAILSKNTNFRKHKFSVTALSEEKAAINKQQAIKLALNTLDDYSQKQVGKMSAVLVKFTDNETKVLPNSNIELKEYPVWIVTFYGIETPINGPLKEGKLDTTDKVILADKNVVIDAATGIELEAFAYPSVLND